MIEPPRYLNLDLNGPGVQRLLDSVVVAEDGAISLAAVHGAAEQLGEGFEVADVGGGMAGIGVAPNGDVYLADTARNRVLSIPGCDGPVEPVGCLESMLDHPRGVLVGPRDALYVADTGNHRILVVDLATVQLRATWGQPDPYGEPEASGENGRFDGPWDLAADGAGRIYVVDHGNRRLQCFDADGRVDASFTDAVAASTVSPREPEYVAVAVLGEVECLLVFDRTGPQRSRLLVYDLDGTFDGAATQRLRRLLLASAPELFASGPGALVATGSSLHVTETATGRVLEFDLTGRFVGFARWHGGAAGLALDGSGRLLVNPTTGSPVRLGSGTTATSGSFRIGPFSVSEVLPTVWQTLRAGLDPLPPDAHARLYAFTTDDETETPPDLTDPAWLSGPVDAAAWLTANEPARCLWVGGRLTAGTAGGPVIRGLHVEFDREGWLRYLPAVYARESSEFLEPALALLEDALVEQEDKLDALPELFDPQAAPAPALPWLAGWLAWELEETLGESAQRALIARAFELQGRRGTAESLRELVRIVLDTDVAVSEPSSSLRLWQLGDETAGLGFGTMLAAAQADGTVLGTAELDRSHLQPEEDYGAPIFDATAHRFCVQVYGSDLEREGARGTLERLIERERPAGVEAHLCVVEPRFLVGFQATVGVDAIVGREPQPFRLGAEGRLGAGAALAGSRRPVATVGLRLGRERISMRGAT